MDDKGSFRSDPSNVNVLWQIGSEFFFAAWIFSPSSKPFHFFWWDPVLMLQNTPNPNSRRDLVFRDPNPFAHKIFGPFNP